MSEPGSRAAEVITARRPAARRIGLELAELIDDPEGFVERLEAGLRALSDATYAETVGRVSPGTGNDLSVRGPLVAAMRRPLERALNEASSASALSLAQRLIRCEERELRLFALPCLQRSLAEDTERSWQLMRQAGARAGDWIEVDSLAAIWARGVLAEPFRWAELEQLVYSQRSMERRLVGATLASLPHRVPRAQRASLRGDGSERAFDLLGQLIGDPDPMVQKSLSWACREWAAVDPDRARAFLGAQAATARRDGDGNRAWVVRDAVASQSSEVSVRIKRELRGLRRDEGAASTSVAARQAAAFAPELGSHDVVDQQGTRFVRSRP